MNIKKTPILSVVLACGSIHAATLKDAYLDSSHNIHVITQSGKDIRVTKSGNLMNVKLSPDGETVAWLIKHPWKDQKDSVPSSSKLVIYRHGRMRSISCEPFIRSYWFWLKGSRIAIDCGGAHFAGIEKLFDANTLRQIDSFDQASVSEEKRPSWSESSDHFQAD